MLGGVRRDGRWRVHFIHNAICRLKKNRGLIHTNFFFYIFCSIAKYTKSVAHFETNLYRMAIPVSQNHVISESSQEIGVGGGVGSFLGERQ